ncbi:Hypothetical predicted protein [Mytilus galloprovincialis]|uniref:RNase H type-1 domain-containing protein n=1 Tax=Mytilus galloprovincialis TaxID=29158 RepID=A0A8B6DU49_MYTGA|nr:Hypothetical predicted protein [Mytilus galloprovincialis]
MRFMEIGSRVKQFESSTWRELETVRRVLNSYDSFLENKTVKVNSDNKNVTHILNVGSKKFKLQKVVTDILNSCSKKNIGLQTNWVPRTENKHADFLSRHTDPDDWSIEKNVFHDLSCTFGPFTVDRFSTHYNAQSSRFNSRIWCPGTEAINAFSQFWGGDTNWLVPPPSLVAMTINKIIKDKAKCMLVIPEWKSAPYWPLLYKDGGFRDFIKEVIYLPRYNIIVKGYRPIFRSGGTAKLIYKNKKLSYTAARQNIVKRLKMVAPQLNLGLHSLRSGGASAAAKSDVNERCIKRHGRWKSDLK